jgi:carboxymethylenebutenolidase
MLQGAVEDTKLVAAVFFDTWNVPFFQSTMLHLPKTNTVVKKEGQVIHKYSDLPAAFIIPGHADFNISTAGVSHTRSVGFIKKHLGGPFFDLESIWDEHTFYEFGDRSVEKTMATMVQEPYVNHVPTVRVVPKFESNTILTAIYSAVDWWYWSIAIKSLLPQSLYLQ